MNTLFDALEDTYEEFKDKLSLYELESIILYSIVELVFEQNLIDKRHISSIKDNIDDIKKNKVYFFLKKRMPVNLLSQDNILIKSYEYLVGYGDRKEKYSIYYTPEWIVNHMINNILKVNNDNTDNVDNIGGIKVLEPACGAGMFLSYIFDVFYNWYVNYTNLSNKEICKKIIEDHLFGVDIDNKGLEVCKYCLMIKMSKYTKDFNDLEFNLYNYDFLKDNDISKPFDIIVGNPPYLENRRINKYFDKAYLKDRYKTAVGRFDIYSLFIEKSIKLLKDDGILSFILPGNLFYNNNFTSIRKLILNKTRIVELINLGEGIFDNVNMNMAIITLKIDENNQYNTISCKNISNKENKMKTLINKEYYSIEQRYYNNLLNNIFDIDSSKTTFELRKRIFKDDYLKINDYCEVIAGIATGNVRKKLISKNGNSIHAKKLLEGKDINRYYHRWKGLYIIYDKDLINREKGEYATFMKKRFIDEEKILIRQTADKFICTYDGDGYYLLNTLYSLIVRDEYRQKIHIKYILGLLNSKFYNFLYKSLIREEGKLFPQVKIFHIQHSPLIIANKSIQNEIIKRVNDIILIKKDYNKINNAHNIDIDKKVDAIASEIDEIIYKIFKLTSEEIDEIERCI